eukprot:14932852-Alexandrium_andersonii.AAC.1
MRNPETRNGRMLGDGLACFQDVGQGGAALLGSPDEKRSKKSRPGASRMLIWVCCRPRSIRPF